MSDDYRIDWPIPDAYLIEVGRIAALWASLESFLNTCIGKLAGFDPLSTDPTHFILLIHSSFPQRLDMLGALCEELKESHPHLLNHKEVISKIKAAQAARNKYAHNGLTYDRETNKCTMAEGSARGKVKTSVNDVSVENIHAVAKEIHMALLALYKLVLKREITPLWERSSTKQ